jgi:hypothetical protein
MSCYQKIKIRTFFKLKLIDISITVSSVLFSCRYKFKKLSVFVLPVECKSHLKIQISQLQNQNPRGLTLVPIKRMSKSVKPQQKRSRRNKKGKERTSMGSYFHMVMEKAEEQMATAKSQREQDKAFAKAQKQIEDNSKSQEPPIVHTTAVDCTFNVESDESKLLDRYFTLYLRTKTSDLNEINQRLRDIIAHSGLNLKCTVHDKGKALEAVDEPTNTLISNVTEIVLRIIASSEKIKTSIENSNTYWNNNILVIKNFRPEEITEQDAEVLRMFYDFAKKYTYSIAESADDLLQHPKKNRVMLSLKDETIASTPIIMEIHYALLTVLDELSAVHDEQPGEKEEKANSDISHDNLNHIIESFAFLYSVKNGKVQKPHLDFGYSLTNPLDLTDTPNFFHADMSYSFLYALEEHTFLHFLDPGNAEEKLILDLSPGDLVIWSGQQVHSGAKYYEKDNLRVFGTIRSKIMIKNENVFYWYTSVKDRKEGEGMIETSLKDLD